MNHVYLFQMSVQLIEKVSFVFPTINHNKSISESIRRRVKTAFLICYFRSEISEL